MKMTFIQIAFSLFPPFCLSVCLCVLIFQLCLCDGTWTQPMEMTGRGYCLCWSFLLQRFSCSCRSFTCTLKHLSRDKYWPSEKFKWGTLFIFLCFCGWGGPWKSQLELVGPNNSHEVELQCGEGQEIAGWVHTGKVPMREELHVCQLGSLLAMHNNFLCHVQWSACIGKRVVWSNDEIPNVKLIQSYWFTFTVVEWTYFIFS